MPLKPSAGDGSALEWIKSSHSSNDGPDCVEVATASDAVHVRDSKHARGPRLAFVPDAWSRFLAHTAGR
ncbi:DUF397 domain-containing protein [Streptomyces sp. TRM43335]|uniref:DUF397 domain-containing protein n=1 Tax=Streptomyces taklimakanensis TaxID=2569853 RepID=A0A6G2BC39_9ACTN|nr:DUF397 domain-containing protein [Streptomyces taklimakanensis]MTE19696.1 DUF397 domain-containing protein [Streptomyces taklimakanensis]